MHKTEIVWILDVAETLFLLVCCVNEIQQDQKMCSVKSWPTANKVGNVSKKTKVESTCYDTSGRNP